MQKNDWVSHSQCGFILASTLIFLAVLTMLSLTMIESNLLETKLTTYEYNQLIVQTVAESDLLKVEASLTGQHLQAPTLNASVYDQVKPQNPDSCLRTNYFIVVNVAYQQVQANLQSTYQVAPKSSPPGCNQHMISHRLWWQEV